MRMSACFCLDGIVPVGEMAACVLTLVLFVELAMLFSVL